MKKFKKVLKICFFSLITLCSLCFCGGIIFYHATTNGLNLNSQNLDSQKISNSLTILTSNGGTLTTPSSSYIKLSKLSSDTKNAFICAEDKRFYSHGGVDFIRMGKAFLSNIKSRSFSQGASTISQQLIKNTQLTNEKTITRKLKEIKLTRELEKKYTKDEILEMYLNNIYFGNGCYGIESAARHYYSKSAAELTLDESASLAATINAPSHYDLEEKPENVKKRRDLILNLMQNSSKINENQCNNAKNKAILLNLQNLTNNTFLFNEVINEACDILNSSPENLANNNIKIYTNIDEKLISEINNILNKNYSNIEANPNIATIIIDNKTKNIISITGNKNLFSSKKQPGSTIKPILVYAPAIEYNLISPSTKLLDEPINISGYKPNNSSHTFHGYTTATEALKNSYNIPAVKLLNELGIATAQNFAKNLGIEFSKSDNNLAIALGGFSEGITLKSLADAYLCFSNNGDYQTSKYITKITKNDTIIYQKSNQNNQVMKDSTAYLITNMLTETSKSGTAKRLKDFDFEIASKTGTVGIPNSTQNKEAFCIAYTTKHTILTYFGGDKMPENINGSTYPTMLTKDIINELYKNDAPKDFKKPKSITNIKSETEENIQVEKNNYFAIDNLPEEYIQNYQIKVYNFKGKKPIIELTNTANTKVDIIRKHKEKEEIILSSSKQEIINFEDKTAISNEIYEYFAKFCVFSNNQIIESNHVALKVF